MFTLTFYKWTKKSKHMDCRKEVDVAYGSEKYLQPAFFLMASRGRLHWLQKEVWLYRSLRENDPTSHLIYYFSKHFPNEFMDSSLVSNLVQYTMMFIW